MRTWLEIIIAAVPIVLMRLVQTLGLLIGNLMIAQLGHEVLAASALIVSISIALFTFSSGTLFSISPIVADAFGSKDFARIREIVMQGFWFATILGVVISVILTKISWLLVLTHQQNDLIQLAQNYFYWFAAGVVPMLWTTVLQQCLIGIEQRKIIVYYSAGRLLLGTLLAYVLIFGKFGFPAMGLNGLGLSITIASWISFFAFAIYLFGWRSFNIFHIASSKQLRITSSMKQIAKLGFPIGFQMSFEIAAIMVATLILGKFGSDALAAQQITSQYLLIASMVPFGISQAVAVMISSKLSQKQTHDAQYVAQQSIFVTASIMLLISLVYYTIPQLLIMPYLHNHATQVVQVTQLTTLFFYIIAMYQFFDGIRTTISGILRGFGNTVTSMLIGIGIFWLIGLPLIILLSDFSTLGAISIPLSLTISVVLATAVLSFYYNKLRRDLCKPGIFVSTASL